MKSRILSLVVLACAVAVHGASLGITSLASNGRLTWTNSITNGLFTTEWAPALGTNWHSDWNSLQNFWVSGCTNTVDVPMFYRVKCATNLLWPFPAGGQFVFSVSNAVGNVSTGQVHVLGYVRPLVPGTNDYALLESLRAGGTSLNLLRSTDTTVTKLDLCNQTEATEYQLGPVGTTWTNYNYECQYTRKVTIDAIEDVTVPAGTFTACYKFHKQILSGTTNSSPEWSEWVKPGFGLVSWVDYWDTNAPVVHRLQSWSVPTPYGGTPTPTAPAAPTGLNATPGNAQVVLTWTASAGATNYHVKRATTSGGTYTQVSAPTGTTYTNTGCTNGTKYYYVVSALNTAGESGNSSEVSATPALIAVDLGAGLMTGKAKVPYSALAKPAKGQRVVDPDFPTTHIVRVTDAKNDWNCAAAIPVYPTIQAWNADESLMILYVTSGLGENAQTGHALFNGRTYAFIKWLDINPADIEQFYWDTVNPDLLYYIDNYQDGSYVWHNVLTRMHVSTGGKDVLHDFAVDEVAGGALSAAVGTQKVSGGEDPFSMSLDNDIIGLGCDAGYAGPGGAENFHAFSYRLSTHAIGQTFLNEATVPQAMPSGTATYFYKDETKVSVLDPVTNAVQRTLAFDGTSHGDMLRNAVSHDIIAGSQYDGPSGSGNLMWADLSAGGSVHTIIGEASGDGYPPAGTLVSGRAYKRPGWVALGITGEIYVTSTYLDQEVLLANIDTGNVYRVAHHRSTGKYNNSPTVDNYWAQPNVTISPSGTRILIQSDWGNGTPGPTTTIIDQNAIVDTYVIELPSYAP